MFFFLSCMGFVLLISVLLSFFIQQHHAIIPRCSFCFANIASSFYFFEQLRSFTLLFYFSISITKHKAPCYFYILYPVPHQIRQRRQTSVYSCESNKGTGKKTCRTILFMCGIFCLHFFCSFFVCFFFFYLTSSWSFSF